MTRFLLAKWSAVELLCHIFSKEEGILFKEFERDNEKFLETLKVYQSAKYSDAVGMKIYRSHIKDGKISRTTAEKSLYNIVTKFLRNEPVVVTAEELNGFHDFIIDKSVVPSLIKIKLSELVLSNNQRLFENTRWWVFMYNDYIETKGNKDTQYSGVTRAVLKLNSFAKVSFNTLEPGSNLKEEYIGTYSMYDDIGDNNKFLLIKMKSAKGGHKDLQIKIYVGAVDPDKIEIALGQFHNYNRSVYSCAIMVEPISNENDENVYPDFFCKSQKIPDPSLIQDHIWRYFQNKNKCVLGVPSTEIVSLYALKNWWNQRKVKDEKQEILLLKQLAEKYPGVVEKINAKK